LKPLGHIHKVMKTFYTVGIQEKYPSRDTFPLNRYGRGEGSQGAVQQGLRRCKSAASRSSGKDLKKIATRPFINGSVTRDLDT
jgi:hypothetical protein